MSDEIERMAERSFRESIALGRIEQRIAEEKRMSDETQPLTTEQPATQGTVWSAYKKAKEVWEEQVSLEEPAPDYRKAWSDLAKLPLFQAFASLPKPAHVHGPFTFLLNQNHNALRGCITCGAAWVGLMAGTPDTLHWHPVAEIEEEEEE